MTLISCAAIILVFTLPPYILACGCKIESFEEDDTTETDIEIDTTETDTEIDTTETDTEINSTDSAKHKNSLFKNKNHHGLTPSPSELQQWNDWYNNYKSQYNESIINPDNLKEFEEERGTGSGWPGRWADAGVGFGGTEPPPWAYAPRNTGKPSYCFLPHKAGVCVPPEGLDPDKYTTPAPSLRFAYHPYKDECVPFIYSGCSGNRNNFYDRQLCEKSCVALAPFNGCDDESHIYIDDVFGGRT